MHNPTTEAKMAIHFSNPGSIDLDVIRTMGVSVKDGENPIGYFGTGLKYAIATLLRTGHNVSLFTNGETIQFRPKEKIIRNKKFQMVMMGDEQLGFTTDLGKDWEVWQAYRELYSNCIDERGRVSGRFESDETVFSVEGPQILEVHAMRGSIFLQSEPWIVGDGIEVHRGKSNYLFYRGVRVQRIENPTMFTYNFTVKMTLTEDRTLSSIWDANYKLATRLPAIPNPEFARKLILSGDSFYESGLEFESCNSPSEEFLDEIEKMKDNLSLKVQLRTMFKKKRGIDEFEDIDLSQEEKLTILAAEKLLSNLDIKINPRHVRYVSFLGPSIYAAVKDAKILIARQTLANGADFFAITYYEEWLHLTRNFTDCSRAMQQYLFDKILELIKK